MTIADEKIGSRKTLKYRIKFQKTFLNLLEQNNDMLNWRKEAMVDKGI